MNKKMTMLMILDGFGINENENTNAVKLANTPNIDKLLKQNPNTIIHTSGLDVGLPDGQMGNSEVGHTNIGAGRIIYQELTRITKSIEEGEFFSNSELVGAIENCKKNNNKLHVLGLLSDGGVHSHIRHLYAILELAKRKDFEDVYVHCFLDGRDTPPASAENYITDLEKKMTEKGVGKIASIMGRFYAMDRDKRWERVQLAYNVLINGEGEKATSAISAIESSYQQEIFDEFVKPTVITNAEGNPTATIAQNDSIIFFNFRPDRAREITRSIVDNEFKEFEKKLLDVYYVCFTSYDETMPNVHIAFKKDESLGIDVIDSARFTFTAAIFSLLAIICYLLCFSLTTERVRSVSSKQAEINNNVFTMLKNAAKNRALISIIAASVVMLLAQLTMQQMSNYVYPVTYGNAKMISVSTVLMVFGMAVAAATAKPLAQKFGKAELSVVSNLFAGITNLLLYFLRPENVFVYIAFQAVSWIGLGVFAMVNWALITDVIDYSEIKNGIREDGSVYALYSFARKLGQAASSGISGALLSLIGYSADNITNEVKNGIFDIATLVPAIGLILLALILWFWYPLKKKQVDENIRLLKEKHENNNN